MQIQALIRIARFGFPYQYRQSLFRDRIGRTLLTTNIAFRLLLNKLSFGLIPPSCIVGLQNPKLTYRQVMRRADLTTAGLSAFALALFWKVSGAGLKRAIGVPGELFVTVHCMKNNISTDSEIRKDKK